MAETKFFEVRDRGTNISVMATLVRPSLADRAYRRIASIIGRAGYSASPNYPNQIVIVHLADNKVTSDPFDWNSRTMIGAHQFIQAHWGELNDGELIDVRFVLGETEAPCASDYPEGE